MRDGDASGFWGGVVGSGIGIFPLLLLLLLELVVLVGWAHLGLLCKVVGCRGILCLCSGSDSLSLYKFFFAEFVGAVWGDSLCFWVLVIV